MDKFPITAAGYARMEEELRRMKTVERPAIIAAISEARAHGDLSENAEYHAAKEKQSFIEGRIQELEDKISRAERIDIAALSGDTVMFGATITIMDEDTEEEIIYQIVSEYEADIKAKKISITAPLAKAFIGKKEEHTVEVKTPGGVKTYTLLSVEYTE